MTESPGLDLVLLWHMHQPDYRDHVTGRFVLPWVYLHAIKDYSDMAGHLEAHAGVRATVNFTPVLLEQIDDYRLQFASAEIRDPLLALLARPDSPALSESDRRFVLDRCFHANHHKMIAPYPRYHALEELAVKLEADGGHALRYLSDQFFFDLLTWYHLAWLGETVRRESTVPARLFAKGVGFSEADRLDVFRLIGAQITELVPRYRKLADSGRVELSTTPYGHPLAPLLMSFASAAEALPNVL
jgi:alpha-amylase/alpha-mannosidase (GH57 family)